MASKVINFFFSPGSEVSIFCVYAHIEKKDISSEILPERTKTVYSLIWLSCPINVNFKFYPLDFSLALQHV